MELTNEQKEIVDHELDPGEVLKVIAFAGTGKTRTLVEYARKRPRMRFLYVAFNKSVQEEAKKLFPHNVECRTSHSLAYKACGTRYRGNMTESTLNLYELNGILGIQDYEVSRFARETFDNFLRSRDAEISEQHVPEMAQRYYRYSTEKPDLVNYAREMWNMMRDPLDRNIRMQHDGYLKLFQLTYARLSYDCILLDETQDINPVTADIILRQECPKILVGDPHQQVYSFRGALDAMQMVTEGSTRYLTGSFRFGTRIAEVANMILQHCKGETHTIEGLNRDGVLGSVTVPYTVICRTNAGVFREVVKVFRSSAITFVGNYSNYGFNDILDMHYLCSGQQSLITNKRYRRYSTYEELRKQSESIEDVETLMKCEVVEEYGDSIPELIKGIQSAITFDMEPCVTFTTTHKAKGNEFNKVKVGNDFPGLYLGKRPKTKKEIAEDEINLQYVAVTRAKESLQLSDGLLKFTGLMSAK